MCERDNDGYPVSNLVWNRDTPHPDKTCGKLTCETLWLAESHKGDYHDNMNSDIFVKWINDSLFPTFRKLYPGKKMVLVCDNAPYHHKRKIGSLALISKKNLIKMMEEYEVDHIDLPLTTSEREKICINSTQKYRRQRGFRENSVFCRRPTINRKGFDATHWNPGRAQGFVCHLPEGE